MIVPVDFVEVVHVDEDDFLRVIIQKGVYLVEGLFCRLGREKEIKVADVKTQPLISYTKSQLGKPAS